MRQLIPFCKCFFIFLLWAAAAGSTAAGDRNNLTWDKLLYPGIAASEVVAHLENSGVIVQHFPGGFTYTSKIATEKRDYLFCDEKLYAVIEGESVDNRRFVDWMVTFMNAQDTLGEPASIQIESLWNQITATWELGKGSEVYFLVRVGEPDKITWSRQLYHIPTGQACGVMGRSTGTE